MKDVGFSVHEMGGVRVLLLDADGEAGPDAIAMLERTPGVQGCLWRNKQLHETRGFRRNVLPQGWDAE